MTNRIEYLALILVAISLSLAAATSEVQATETPDISSSLAKNLWRQAHFYYEEGMDAKAIRACEELQAWARENNEPAIEKEMTEMLAVLRARQQAPAASTTTADNPAAVLQTHLPACGYASVNDISSAMINKVITNTPKEFNVCQQDQDCTIAYGFCGANKAVNKVSKNCFEAVSLRFIDIAGCSPLEPIEATAVCRNQACTLQFQ